MKLFMSYGKDAYRGKYTPEHPEKYVGDVKDIVYRSSLERMFMVWCDRNINVLKWNSEGAVVPYISPVDNIAHRYFVDFVVQIRSKSGDIRTYLIEIKPSKFTKPPTQRKKTKSYLSEVTQWHVNQAKWDAAKKFCQKKGWEFMIITEQDLRKQSS